MALISCPACERRVSAEAATCPGCGYPLVKRRAGATTGGNAVVVLLSLVVGLVLAGLANYISSGNVAAVAICFFGPIVWALVRASRTG